MKKKRTLVICLSMAALLGVASVPLAIANSGNWTIAKQIGESLPMETKSIEGTFPANGGTAHILKPSVLNYLNAMYEQAKGIEDDYVLHDFYVSSDTSGSNYGISYSNETDLVRIDDYYNPSVNEEQSKKVVLAFSSSGFDDGASFSVRYGLTEDLEDAEEIVTTENYVTINNLLSGKTYYWKVTCESAESETYSFTADDGFRMVTASGISNIRDMGGRKVSGGKRIKQGLVFRGGEMVNETYSASGSTHYANLNANNRAIMQDELGIKYEVDFRGDDEANNITASPLYDESHDDIEYLRIANLSAYDYFFKMDSSDVRWSQVKQMFLAFKDSADKPVYFHCWGGADRTGTIGFLLGGLLGMSYTDLVIDFELTSFACNFRPHYKNDANKVYRFPQLIYQMKNAVGSDGNKYYEDGKSISDIVKDVLIDKAGLSEDDIAGIKNALLEG